MFLGLLTLLVAISISVIAAYYSILGLTAIFAAAFLPIVLMGSVLEVGKILATVWLHIHWKRAPFIIKGYLTSTRVLRFHCGRTRNGDLSPASDQCVFVKIKKMWTQI